MSVLVTRILESLILPPLGPMLLVLFGLLFRRFRAFAWLGLVIIYISSLPATQVFLATRIEAVPPLKILTLSKQDRAAIVILAYDSNPTPREFVGPANYGTSLDRIRYGAHIHKETGLPVLVSGGDPLNEGVIAADVMFETLSRDFGIHEVMLERKSVTTNDHGIYVTALLKKKGFDSLILVTTASHMTRAMRVFEHSGLRVIPAPTAFQVGEKSMKKMDVFSWIPNAGSALYVRLLLHEWLGDLWYRLKHSATYASA
jgi:uncharacterized SAM-binding protein YcdF (DUF218 family)